MKVVTCESILGRCEFRSYSEFLFMMCIGQEYHRLGYVFDVRSMSVSKNLIGDAQLNMYKWLVYEGQIEAGVVIQEEPKYPNVYYFNMDAITENEGALFREDKDCYFWSNTWAKEQNYGKYGTNLYCVGELGNILLHLVAHMAVSIFEKKVPKKKIVVYIDGLIGKSTDSYVNLVSCRRTIPWLEDLLEVKTDYDTKSTDVEFSLFVNDGIMAGRNKHWSITDKLEQMDLEGIIEGSICVLFERNGLADTNRVGKISNSSIVRVNKIDREKKCLMVTVIPVYRTMEEVYDDYIQIPDELRYMFADMLEYNIKLFDRVLSLYSLGISNYLYDEELFIVPIDIYGVVDKVITVEGKTASVRLSQRDAIYWLLCQYKIDFDRVLYRKMYNNGEPMLYDLHGES